MSDPENRRLDDRLPVRWKATLMVGDEEFPCEVGDVSFAGTLVVMPASLHPGQEALLLIDELGEFAARVQWVQGTRCGLTLMAGPELLLKKLAEASQEYPSTEPGKAEPFSSA